MELTNPTKTICRVCLSVDESQLFIWHSPILGLEDQLTYAELFRQLTRLEVDDGECLPQLLCHSCASDLRSIYDFIKKAYYSDQVLRSKDEGVLRVKEAVSPIAEVMKANFEWVGVCKENTAELSTVAEKVIEETVNIKVEPFDSGGLENRLVNPYGTTEPTDTAKNCNSSSFKNSQKREIKKAFSSKKSRTRRNKVRECSKSGLDRDQLSICAHCNESFPQKELNRHIRRIHKAFLCHICPRAFKQAENLRQHTLAHEGIRERPYACELCSQKFYTKRSCQVHTKTHDVNRTSHFQCDQCEKSFLHKPSLKLHQLSHTDQALECKICQKHYFRPVDLKVHMRTHSGDMPFVCPYCEKGFPQKGEYTKHVRRHEGFRYKCEICGKEYGDQSTLIRHRREHTGLPFKCGLCDKGFVEKSKMRRHIGNVHKVKSPEEMEKLIVKVSTTREYRGRILSV